MISLKTQTGVYVGSARGGAQESFWLRRLLTCHLTICLKMDFVFQAVPFREVSSLEKVEILKRKFRFIIWERCSRRNLNMVTKTPQF